MKKRLFAVLLCAVMTVGSVMPAFADEIEIVEGVQIVEEQSVTEFAEEEVITDTVEDSVENGVILETDDIQSGLEENLSEAATADDYVSEDGETLKDGVWTYSIIEGDCISIEGCDTESGEVVIPSTIDGKSVTSIGDSAFQCRDRLTSIIIPSSVTRIEDYAFQTCRKLTSITIPNSVTSIGKGAFYSCSRLTSIEIPNGVTSIGDYVFFDCSGLTSITIPSSVTSIGDFAFAGCSGLTSITIPSSVTSIGGLAFAGCSGLTSISIPGSVTSIGEKAFRDCSSLTNIEVAADNPKYESKNEGKIIIEKSNKRMILGCKGATIPNDVCIIGSFALASNIGLTSISIPDSVTSIEKGAFESCSQLTSITIPSSVTSIGDEVFLECSGLTSIEIPNGVTSIGERTFAACRGLTSINIPNSVTSIGERAFAACRGLTSINIPNSVTSIGNSAFANCSGLTSVSIPNSVTSIGINAFYGCSDLTSISIPNSVTSIEKEAFAECIGLTSISIPNNVTSIGKSAFYGCGNVTSIEIPDSVTSIGEYAFFNCSSLTSVEIPNSVTSIGEYALGYYYGDEVKKIDSFSIHGLKGSEAARYAKDNGFAFVNIMPLYTVAFDGNGATSGSMAPINCVMNKNYTLRSNAYKRTGYTFDSWNTKKDGSGKKYANKAEIKNLSTKDGAKVTLYARWNINTYTISYKLNGGKNGKNPASYKVTTSDITLKNPTRTGYTFKGWYSDKKLTKKVTSIKKGSTGNKTLYAKWAANKYTIKYNANGGKGSMKSKSMTYDKSAKLTKNAFSKKGYTFLGWSTDKKATKARYKNQAEVKNLSSKSGGTVTLYAVWKKK